MEQENADTAEPPPSSDPCPGDAVYRALRAPDRRFIVHYLSEQSTVDIETLADVLTGRRSAVSGRVQDRRDRERVRVQLRHRDLPALAAADLVDFDPDTGRVTLEPLPEPVARLVARSARDDGKRS